MHPGRGAGRGAPWRAARYAVDVRTVLVFGLVFGAFVAASACGGGSEARVLAPDGSARLAVRVEIARTEVERRTGLSDRDALAVGEGLVIEFPLEGEACITNAPVVFPIDVVFADETGAVVAVERALAAGDPGSYCYTPVRRALEVSAGVAAEVAIGDALVVTE